jgi:hypothetical protein
MKRLSEAHARSLVLASIAVTALLGCDGHAPVIVIPDGGQVVHAVIAGGAIRLDPATARAGDVYLVVDTPDTSVVFIEGMAAPEASAGPLSDSQIDALRESGRTYHTAITCCYMHDSRGGASAKLALPAGKYVFVIDDPAQSFGPDRGPIPSAAMAVLQVNP